jgi:hypothetical protein
MVQLGTQSYHIPTDTIAWFRYTQGNHMSSLKYILYAEIL